MATPTTPTPSDPSEALSMSFETTDAGDKAEQGLDTPATTESPLSVEIKAQPGSPDGSAGVAVEGSAPPVAPTEPTPANWRDMPETKSAQSSWDKQVAQERNARIAAGNRVVELERQVADTSREAQVTSYRQSERERLLNDGHSEIEAERQSSFTADQFKQQLTSQAEVTRLQNEQAQTQAQTQAQAYNVAKGTTIAALSDHFNLPIEIQEDFVGIDDPELMLRIARRHNPEAPLLNGESPVTAAAPTSPQNAGVRSGVPTQSFDSGTGTTGTMTDDQILAAYSDDSQPDPPFAQVEQIMRQRGQHPFG